MECNSLQWYTITSICSSLSPSSSVRWFDKRVNNLSKMYRFPWKVRVGPWTKVRRFDSWLYVREIPSLVIRGAILTSNSGSFSCAARSGFSDRNDENYFEFKDRGALPSANHRRDKLSTKAASSRVRKACPRFFNHLRVLWQLTFLKLRNILARNGRGFSLLDEWMKISKNVY